MITHLHIDHCYDLLPLGKSLLKPMLRFPGAPEFGGECRPVPLVVRAGAKELFARWSQLFPIASMPVLNRAFEMAYDVREYEPGALFGFGDCAVELHELVHSAPNCGIHVTDAERTLAYTGDTGMTDALVKLAADADVVLCEATLRATDTTGHGYLSAAAAGRAATGCTACSPSPERNSPAGSGWPRRGRRCCADRPDGGTTGRPPTARRSSPTAARSPPRTAERGRW
ncbi:MBL fold metallo-hydrolase [Amycolatopsis thermophila]|uniref:Glyoxylase-like metal-dependent hydrolase (Beta-lactamase superfamily II) n=1 Tax=Amycolatopsis thermophila TaxID=206084 RepID=A0ABU0F5X3_9PSEU|nr:MBL fold metallo-hydrolase [Amycolatopsis thermophila]MDQ0382997.1 glyoxylase-like metal-dependent hydrolase (beta-lactamase superfamily II) [Amycolatopsis thermophila]